MESNYEYYLIQRCKLLKACLYYKSNHFKIQTQSDNKEVVTFYIGHLVFQANNFAFFTNFPFESIL